MVSLTDSLRDKLSKTELKHVPKSFDIIGSKETGSVAIIDIPVELEKKKKAIATALMKAHSNVRTVLRRLSERQEQFRLREFEWLAGEKDTEVIHKESGVRLKLDPQKVYFSPREGMERERVRDQIKRGETVMIFFAGAGPYVCLIGKQTRAARVVGIEINPSGYEYMKENIRLNKLENCEAVLGDVKESGKQFTGKCDRVVMPVRFAKDFLDEAVSCLKKKGGVINFYFVAPEDDLYSEAIALLRAAAKKQKRKVKIIGKRKVAPYASRVYKVCVDAQVT